MTDRTRVGYEMLDHPADLRLRVWAPDLHTLFRQAARALIENLFPGEAGAVVHQGQEMTIQLDGLDTDDLLVLWLGELLFQAETRRLVPQAIQFNELNGGQLRASCTMRRAGTPDCEIKAVTYHQAGIRKAGSGLETILLFDV